MKNIYLVAFFLFPFAGIPQELIRLSSDNERAQYFEVVPVFNNQETLFKNSKLWIHITFADSNAVIDLEDKVDISVPEISTWFAEQLTSEYLADTGNVLHFYIQLSDRLTLLFKIFYSVVQKKLLHYAIGRVLFM